MNGKGPFPDPFPHPLQVLFFTFFSAVQILPHAEFDGFNARLRPHIQKAPKRPVFNQMRKIHCSVHRFRPLRPCTSSSAQIPLSAILRILCVQSHILPFYHRFSRMASSRKAEYNAFRFPALLSVCRICSGPLRFSGQRL